MRNHACRKLTCGPRSGDRDSPVEDVSAVVLEPNGTFSMIQNLAEGRRLADILERGGSNNANKEK